MTESRFFKPVVYAVVLFLTGLVLYANWPSEKYTTKIVMSSAANLAIGAPVWVNGFEAGSVMGIDTKNGKAIVTAGIAPGHAPLHAGTKARIQWYAALGERILTIYPGPESNPAIPDGGMYEAAESKQVEVDQVLSALDTKTRGDLNGLIRSVNATTGGKEKEVQATLRSLGPTVQAAGAIFEAVGRDGPAIRALVTQLHDMIEVTAKQQDDIKGFVTNVNTFAGQVATTQSQLSSSLQELPGTLRETNATLHAIPSAVEPTNALLKDLRPATKQLPGVADDLDPFMHDLRPVIHDLRPSLESARDMLDYSPGFLEGTNEVFPELRDFLHGYQPAVGFLRPYVPEAVGWLQNWGKNFGSYNSRGHLWAAVLGEVGPAPLNVHVVNPPPLFQDQDAKPGQVINQPWDDPAKPKDANGSPVQ
jgi:phospholipid/cholesterol/gamma-HCH transport system substrate-binding protein